MSRGETVKSGLVTVELNTEFASNPQSAALALAASRGKTREVEALVHAGADVNATGDFYRVSPLMWAVLAGSTEGIQALLKASADPNLRVPALTEEFEKTTYTRLTGRPIVGKDWQVYQSDLLTFDGESALSLAVEKRNLDHLRLLLEAGGDPNLSGRTEPVMFDCLQTEDKPSPFLKLLIERGGDPNLIDVRGPVIAWYLFVGHAHNVIYLMEQGADPTLTLSRLLPGTGEWDEPLDDTNSFGWNEAAALVQRAVGKEGKGGSDSIRQIHTMMIERGVRFPVYDEGCQGFIPETELKTLSFYGRMRRCHMPDELIQKIIDYNRTKDRYEDIRLFAEEYAADLAARKK